MKKIRVTMQDAFSGAKQSKELLASNKQLITYNKAMLEERIIRKCEDNAAMEWVITEIEII